MPSNTCKVTDLQFAMSCLNNISSGTVDYQQVMTECGMSSVSAATQKLNRMKKAHALSSDGSSVAASPADKGTPAADGTPTKAKKPATPAKGKKAAAKEATPSKKRKLDGDDQETEHAVKTEAEGDGEDWLD